MKPNPNPCHHVYYGVASSALMGALAIGLSEVLGLSMPFRHHATGVKRTCTVCTSDMHSDHWLNMNV